MWATTELFLAVQRLYKERADRDTAAVAAHLGKRLSSIGRSPDSIPAKTLRHFVKHAHSLRVVRWRELAQEIDPKQANSAAIRQALAAEDQQTNSCLYLLLRAVDRFHALHSRFPGCYDREFENDVPLLKTVATGIMAEVGAGGSALVDDLVHEMVRFGAGELHTVAAVMGGIAAQEAIKLLTHQFVPLSGTLIFNGMAGTSSVFNF